MFVAWMERMPVLRYSPCRPLQKPSVQIVIEKAYREFIHMLNKCMDIIVVSAQ